MKKIKDAFPDLNRELKFIPLGKEKPKAQVETKRKDNH